MPRPRSLPRPRPWRRPPGCRPPRSSSAAATLNEVNLVYPEQALVERRGGVVTLRLKIDHLGALRDVAVVEAHPAGVFENAAIEAVSALKFQAARRNGVPVGSLKTIEIPFDPDCMRNSTCVAGPQDKAAAR